MNLTLKDLAPSGSHPLGTDDNGYDVLGRLMLGGQSSLELGFAVAIVTTLIGTAYGAIAGIASGIIDGIMMRIVDTFLAIPWLVLLLIMVNATFSVADAILALSTLSFLGLGLPPPHTDWGTMLTSGLNEISPNGRSAVAGAGTGTPRCLYRRATAAAKRRRRP